VVLVPWPRVQSICFCIRGHIRHLEQRRWAPPRIPTFPGFLVPFHPPHSLDHCLSANQVSLAGPFSIQSRQSGLSLLHADRNKATEQRASHSGIAPRRRNRSEPLRINDCSARFMLYVYHSRLAAITSGYDN